jgi:NitT/TauT family transport system substrate-binding protein
MADAPAMIASLMGYFRQDLGSGVQLDLQPFLTVSQENQALARGQLAVAYTDPIAAIMSWQHDPAAIRIISGAASGGAELVVRHNITADAGLRGARLAVPAAASAQDVALRYWLRQHHLTATITAMPGATAVSQFAAGKLSGGWEPPPYDTEMAADNGNVLVNENALWPAGQFTTAVLVANRQYMSGHTAAINGLLKAQIQATQFLTTSKISAQAAAGNELATTTAGKGLTAAVLKHSFEQLNYTNDPLQASLFGEAEHAAMVGVLKSAKNLRSIYDLNELNVLLRASALPMVKQ